MADYTLANSPTPDNFNITIDGKPDGPGPGLWTDPKTAYLAAADWMWIYAEADRQLGGLGHESEWETYIYLDSNSKYGFTTPEKTRETSAGNGNPNKALKKLGSQISRVDGTMHCHPRGRPTPEGLREAMGLTGESVPAKVESFGWEYLPGSENFSPPDREAAERYPGIWHALLTPRGAVKRIKSTGRARRIAVERSKEGTSAVDLYDPKVLAQDGVFDAEELRKALGPGWKPKEREWRKARVEAVAHELSHTIQGRPQK